jgi:hypothetical protein
MKKGPSVHSTELSYNLTTLLPHTSSSHSIFAQQHNKAAIPLHAPQQSPSPFFTLTGQRSIGQRSKCQHLLSLDDHISRRSAGDNLRPGHSTVPDVCTPMKYVKLFLIDCSSSITCD